MSEVELDQKSQETVSTITQGTIQEQIQESAIGRNSLSVVNRVVNLVMKNPAIVHQVGFGTITGYVGGKAFHKFGKRLVYMMLSAAVILPVLRYANVIKFNHQELERYSEILNVHDFFYKSSKDEQEKKAGKFFSSVKHAVQKNALFTISLISGFLFS